MKRVRLTTLVATAVGLLLVPLVFGQSTTTDAGRSSTARQQALAEITLRRDEVIQETLNRWRFQFQPFDPKLNTGGDEERLTLALQRASTNELLAASLAQTWEELSTALSGALSGRWEGPSVVALQPGEPIQEFLLGEANTDLVFFPLTPCRIIDTRFMMPANRIGPNDGVQFDVNLADYSTQGGFAGSCGIPLTFDPAAVAINVVSTDQTGLGNLRVFPTGAGIPVASLVNYTPGLNIANAGVVRQAQGLSDDIFIYSGNSASHVVVDIMGYFAAPTATAVDNNVLVTTSLSSPDTPFSIFSPPCPAGWRLTGGGHFGPPVIQGADFGSSRPVQGTSTAVISGVNVADRWNCQGSSGPSGQTFNCFSVCSRVPGR